ncbi:MAG: aminodeoxychorismate synthase component I, partial [Spirochaetales bacterium]
HQTIELQDLRDHSIVDVFGRLADKPMTSILVSGGSHDCARFSILGYDPFCVLRSKGRETRLTRNGSTETITGDPLAVLESVLNQNRVAAANPSLPITAGGIGYFGYEMKNLLEKLPQTARDDLDLPDMHFCFYRSLLIHDGKYNTWQLCTFTPPGERDDHESRVRDLLAACSGPAPKRQKGGSSGRSSVQSNFTKQEYLDTVEKIRQYIINGHIYQANLSQRFSAPFTGDPYLSFTQLFGMNPAPFYAYLDCGDFKVVSTSPERFLFRKGAFVETRPIKGTRPRGKTAPDDESLKKELLESAKDEAELSMIVDLMRNDLSKVCCGDSVRVAEHKRIEGYTNVFHLVSVVQGRLRDDLSPLDPIRACFPGGSITGCPKIRAMEIIDELEPNARGVYTGSIGYISFHDSMDLNIAIRTSVVKNGTIYFNVGGAVVYDSDPEEEYLETLYKGECSIKNLQASYES